MPSGFRGRFFGFCFRFFSVFCVREKSLGDAGYVNIRSINAFFFFRAALLAFCLLFYRFLLRFFGGGTGQLMSWHASSAWTLATVALSRV